MSDQVNDGGDYYWFHDSSAQDPPDDSDDYCATCGALLEPDGMVARFEDSDICVECEGDTQGYREDYP